MTMRVERTPGRLMQCSLNTVSTAQAKRYAPRSMNGNISSPPSAPREPLRMGVFAFPASHRMRLCTTNGLEYINRELRRRTPPASFPTPIPA